MSEINSQRNQSNPAVIIAVLAVTIGIVVTAAVVIRKRLKNRSGDFTAV